MNAGNVATLTVRGGVCHALYAFDIGLATDLTRCGAIIGGKGRGLQVRPGRRAPKYFDYSPAPLLATEEGARLRVGSFETAGDIDYLVYDYGGLSIGYEIPFSGGLEAMCDLSCELGRGDVLLADARRRAVLFLDRVRAAVQRPMLSEPVEDYAVFEVAEYESTARPEQFHELFAQALARVLRGEQRALSDQEVADALACRISFETDDVTLIDWNAAIVFDRDADDVRAVLEFANSELQEMRHLDRELDQALDRSYDVVSRQGWLSRILPGSSGASVRRISQMQVDAAMLFERVSNAPKLLGDQYLARVYRLAAQRFHLPEWNATTLRKLDALGDIYQLMHDRAASWRLEALEWIIVLLIAFEVVMSFVRP